MTRLTPADARVLLRQRAEDELAEERLDPPAWAPFEAMHPPREVRAADAAARSRVEHALRLAEVPERVLNRLIGDGWHPGRG